MENKDTKNKGKAAFACVDSENRYLQMGLTKREYFAIQILNGLNSNGMTTQEGVEPPYCCSKEERVQYAIAEADELIKQLNE